MRNAVQCGCGPLPLVSKGHLTLCWGQMNDVRERRCGYRVRRGALVRWVAEAGSPGEQAIARRRSVTVRVVYSDHVLGRGGSRMGILGLAQSGDA